MLTDSSYKDCQIGQNVAFHGRVILGKGSVIQDNVVLGHQDDGVLVIGVQAFIRSGTVIYSDVVIGDQFRTGHGVLVRENTKIGSNVLVGSATVIDGNCTLGSDIALQTGVYVCPYTLLEDNVFLGPHAVTTNDKYMVYGASLKGPTIRRGARIGANATILPDVEIGAEAIVAAGAVVTHSVAPKTVVLGVPAHEK